MTQWTRRDLLEWGSQGLAATALLALLQNESKASLLSEERSTLPEAKAKRVVHICLIGGLSHLDSFDYKPELAQFHGKSLQSDEKPDIFFGQVGLLRKSDWEFKKRGQSGLWVSELFPEIAKNADQLTVIKSMISGSANHTPALFVENSGFEFNGYPSLGSWLSYGLGTMTEELPAYVVLPDGRGGPNGGASNWSNGFLPGEHQGVVLQNSKQLVRDLFPAKEIDSKTDQATRDFVAAINRHQTESRMQDDALKARLRSYELAASMQLSVPRISDLSQETAATRDAYGIDREPTADMGRRCLLARRLLESGVRMVQLYSGGPIGGSPRASWDAHENVAENHGQEGARIDKPIAALLQDLKQRGLLEDTLVLFTTEFGRTPFTQSAADQVGTGRDHNRYAFSVWMAGAGLKPGFAFGETDAIGWKSASKEVTWNDFHATVLHLLGIDHTQLTYYHNGIRRRLTNVHGEVLKEVLA